jgi:ribosomal-protein-alanine N-acetyltransferase
MMNFRLYQPGDFEQIYAIEEHCFQPPLRFSRAYIRGLMNNSSAATWVAEEAGALAGFGIIEWLRDPSGATAYVETLEVAENWRNRGIGAELLRRMEESASNSGVGIVWLHVDVKNAAAIRLYEAHGYVAHGREEDYYGQDRPALIYAKPLTGPVSE